MASPWSMYLCPACVKLWKRKELKLGTCPGCDYEPQGGPLTAAGGVRLPTLAELIVPGVWPYAEGNSWDKVDLAGVLRLARGLGPAPIKKYLNKGSNDHGDG